MLQILKAPITLMLDVLFPPGCAACGQEVAAAHTLCYGCFSKVRMISDPCCACCGEPFSYAMGQEALCGNCISSPPSYDRARSAMVYDEASRAMITGFKYGDRTHLSVALSRLLLSRSGGLHHAVDWVVPVPLHWKRKIARRYNQSTLLARQISAHSGAKLAEGMLLRMRATPQQTGLSKSERARNVRGAFRVTAQGKKQLAGKKILLVDDVMTTGATIESCAAALKKAGAQEVRVLTVARRVISA